MSVPFWRSIGITVEIALPSRPRKMRRRWERKAMPQPTLKTLPFAQPTQCRRYEGRVAIVTGAAQGLGLVIARRLTEEGADVVACDIQEERLQRAAHELQEGTKQRILPFAGDLSEAGVAEALSASRSTSSAA